MNLWIRDAVHNLMNHKFWVTASRVNLHMQFTSMVGSETVAIE